MDGILFVRTVETLLAVQGVQKMDFYEASGISTAPMAQYRTGYAKNAGSRTVRRAANYFNMTPDDFEHYLESTKKAPSQMAEGQSAAKQALVQFILRMPDDQAEELLSELASRLSMGSAPGADPESR